MRLFKTKLFSKWATKEGLTNQLLIKAIQEIKQGAITTNLGSHIYKQRIGLEGRGKRGGARTLLAFRVADKAFFIYGFMKNEKDNINYKELKALKLLAQELLNYSPQKLQEAINNHELKEVKYHD